MKIKNINWYDIKVTKSLLKKNIEELSDDEKKAIFHYKEIISKAEEDLKTLNGDIIKNCPILCSGYDNNFISSPGWSFPIKKFCYSLEALNHHYKKYGISVTSSQNKSKYGEYRCYYDINVKPNIFIRILTLPFNVLLSFIDKFFKFSFKNIKDEDAKVEIRWNEISKEDFEMRKSGGFSSVNENKNNIVWSNLCTIITDTYSSKNYNGEDINKNIQHIAVIDDLNPSSNTIIDLKTTDVFKEENGKYYYAYEINCCAKYHRELLNNKFIFFIRSKLNYMISCIELMDYTSVKRMLMMHEMECKVEELYQKCQKECASCCEMCGAQIGTDYSPACETRGWISYICDRCATADGGEYFKNNKKYIEDREIEDTEKEKHN